MQGWQEIINKTEKDLRVVAYAAGAKDSGRF